MGAVLTGGAAALSCSLWASLMVARHEHHWSGNGQLLSDFDGRRKMLLTGRMKGAPAGDTSLILKRL